MKEKVLNFSDIIQVLDIQCQMLNSFYMVIIEQNKKNMQAMTRILKNTKIFLKILKKLDLLQGMLQIFARFCQ